MSLIDYWPTASEVNACIKPEAEGTSEAVLMAVHQPAPIVYRLAKSTEEIPTSEDELFEHFLSEDVATGAHVVPITGDSGVGKSHLIRLLAARLKTSAHADRYVVVRIPKSASLRKVVELILEPLPAKPYGAVREAFENALAEVDSHTAAIRFQAAIDISLRDLSQDLVAQLKQNPTNQLLKERLDHSRRLPLLISDAVTRDYFRSGPLLRVVQKALSGRHALQDEAQQFCAADLDLPDDLDLSKSAEQVRFYYRTTLQAREGHGKTIASEVLNTVMDAAIRQSFHLNDSLGGMTLQDVILEIRKLLLKDGRELVMLIEDFRALTGIQETLLNVLIQEGVRDGVQTYATMRSAIAVTEGYLTGRDTIATRAGREWIIKSHLPTEEEVLHRTKYLVAAYLNAARWGEKALKDERVHGSATHRFREIGATIFGTDENEDVARKLNAFDRVSGVPLFPLTQGAIEYFAGQVMKEGDELVFKPRAIIGFLREVLLFGRSAFVEKVFPPASIKSRQAVVEVAQWLSQMRMPAEQRARYERLVVIWGNNPQRLTDVLRIPSEVFEAFSLSPPPAIEGERPADPPHRTPIPQSKVAPPPDDARLTRMANYRKEMESWVQQDGPPLSQEVAREIRSALSAAISDRIDWNQERCVKISITPTQIAIPHSRGSGHQASAAIAVTQDRADPDGRLRGELEALLRYHQIWKREMSYIEVDDDLARIGNLLERLLPHALSIVRSTVLNQTASASVLLAANSRVLGLVDSGRTAGALTSFLFGDPPSISELPSDAPEPYTAWIRTRQEAAGIRPQLITALLKTSGCYQGTGDTTHGVDIARIIQAFPVAAQTTSLDTSFLPSELRESLSGLSDQRVNVRARHAATAARDIQSDLETKLGPTVAKNEVVDAMLELAEQLKALGVWLEEDVGISFNSYKALCEEFRSCSLKESLGQMERVNPDESASNPAAFIAQVSRVDFRPLLVAARFLRMSEQIVKYGDRHAGTIEEQYHDVQPELQAVRLREEFERMLVGLGEMNSEGNVNVAAPRK